MDIAVQHEIELSTLVRIDRMSHTDRILAVDEMLTRSTNAAPYNAIATLSLVRDELVPAAAPPLLLEERADHCGSDLPRLKGLIQIVECPDRPAIIHGVQHVFHHS